MKVQLVYIIGIDGGDAAERQACMAALKKKYEARGSQVVSTTLEQLSEYYKHVNQFGSMPTGRFATKGGKDAFACLLPLEAAAAAAQANPGSVGIYFVFHGRRGNSDSSVNFLQAVTLSVMNKHPNGGLKKVVFVVCGFGGVGNYGGNSLLTTFTKRLEQSKKPDLPKVAAWSDGITVKEDGTKLAGSGQPLKTPAKELASAQKVVFIFSGDKYNRINLNGPTDPRWHDPDVATISTTNTSMLVPDHV